MSAYTQLRRVPLTHKDLKRMAPRMRFLGGPPTLTSVLDSEINCTLCGGSKLAITMNEDGTGHWGDCPNCLDPVLGRSTGKMKSRTSEEAYQIRRANS